MPKQNRVLQKLYKVSDEIHKMETNGVELTEQEDNLWTELTQLIESQKKNSSN